jgi:hypothetical protein
MTVTPTHAAEIVASSDKALSVFSGIAAFEAAQRMAKMLCTSTLVPPQYRGQENLPNCIIALEISARLGVSPFTVMQNLHLVNSRPSWSSAYLIASVNSSGRFTPLRFVLDDNVKPTSCYAVATDKQSGLELVGETITMKMASDEGWLSKNGSKWKTMPGQMLRYRAASFWVRIYCPEVSLGLKTDDEIIEANVKDVTAPSSEYRQLLGSTGLSDPSIERVSTSISTLTSDQHEALIAAMSNVLTETGQQAFIVDICDSYDINDVAQVPATGYSKLMKLLGNSSNQEQWNQGLSVSGQRIVEPQDAVVAPTQPAQPAQPAQAELIPAEPETRRQAPPVKRQNTLEDEL